MSVASPNDKSNNKKRKNKIDYGDDFKPPDGGWGWCVCIASGLTNMCTAIIIKEFGLIFRDHLQEININNSEITTITNTYLAVEALSEFLIAPFFRWFSYRQIAIAGAILLTLGTYLTIHATIFFTFLLIYSIMIGFGKGINAAAKNIAFNVYFKKNRKRGNGLVVVITAIGPLFSPYLVLALLENFALNGTIITLAIIAMSSIALSWVYKPITIPLKDEKSTINNNSNNNNNANEVDSHEYETDTINNIGMDPNKDNEKIVPDSATKNKTPAHKKLAKYFDLKLLKDWRYCNIIFGLTLVQFVEANYDILTPFILSDFGYSYSTIALIMSISKIPDILSRFLSPFIVERINWDNRVYYLIALGAMTASEIIISQNPPYEVMFACFIWSGAFRGLRMVFTSIIIPDYVPLKHLPGACGLLKIITGIFLLACGPVIGSIRDASHNYSTAVLFLVCLSVLVLITWTVDLIFQYKTNKNGKQNSNEEQEKADSECDLAHNVI